MIRRLKVARGRRRQADRALTTVIRRIGPVVMALLAAFACTDTASGEVSFRQQIRPILAEHCLHCHGPDEQKREGNLRLDLESSSKKKSIVVHQPDNSEVIKRITSTIADQKMPPAETGKSLTAAEVRLLRQWIAEGAKYEDHWAFERFANRLFP